jgi:predicted kinase
MSKVILLRGKAGSGKTTLSKILGRRLNLTVLHKDDIYDTVSNYEIDRTINNKICFDILYRLLESSLECGADIIVDFGYNNLDDVEMLEYWITQRQSELKTILCICNDKKVWAERLNQRKENPLPNQLLTEVEDLEKYYSKVRTGVLPSELVLDTKLEIDKLVEQAIKYINF